MSKVQEKLFEVARIENGWLVTVFDEYGNPKQQVFRGEWDHVATVLQGVAFPFPAPDEPRGPRPVHDSHGREAA